MLKAGFSRLDITPPLGAYLIGYYGERFAKGVLDPLEMSALALSDDKKTVLLIASDLEGIRMGYANRIRYRISKKTGIPTDCIFISAMHQHTSVGLADTDAQGRRNKTVDDTAYMDILMRRFEDVCVMALDDMSDAEWGYAEKETSEQIAFVRRYLLNDGRVRTNPNGEEDKIIGPTEPPDNTVRLIKFTREGKKDIAFINFQTHPDVIGGEMISADWPGFARRLFEKKNENALAFLMIGFQGDSNHANFMGERKRGYSHSRHMGDVISDTATSLMSSTQDAGEFTLSCKTDLVYNETSRDKEEYYDECLELCRSFERDGKPTKTASGISYVEAYRIVRLKESEEIYQKFPVSVINMGNISLVCAGCQPFTNYAASIRKAHPDKVILTSSLTNGNESYVPTKIAFTQGGYEVVACTYTQSVADEFLTVVNKLLK